MGQTVVVVDDDPGFRSLVGRLLNATGFDVVGDAADGEEALAVTRRLHPDIVLLDVQMPGRDGFSVARQLLRESTSVAVVLTSVGSGCGFWPLPSWPLVSARLLC